jgi:GAF domain-containing protein/CheY-like chemotaxis protein/HAMP domain-containing protein/two-component sensor histidine kinase
LGLSLASLLIANISMMFFFSRAIQRSVNGELLFAAQGAAKTVASFVEEKFGELETATRLGRLASASPEEQKRALGNLLGLDPSFRQLVLLDTQGQELVMASRLSQAASTQLTDHVEGDVFTQIRLGDRYISPVYIHGETNEPMVVIAIPATDVFGDVQGTLLAEVNLKFMWDLVDRLEIGETGLAYVVDRQGNLLAFGDISRVLLHENVSQLKEVSEFVKSPALFDEDGVSISQGINGATVIGTYVPLGTPDWAVVTEMPIMEAFQQGIQSTVVSVLILAVVATSAGLLGSYSARRLTAPLLTLTNTATRIAGGELDLRASQAGPAEVVTLARAFNQMTAQLRELIGGLEQQVAARTADLARRTSELEAAAYVARQAAGIRDPGILLNETVRLISDRFGFYHAGIFLLDERGEYAVLRAASSEGGKRMLARGHKLEVGKVGIVGYVAGTGQPRIALDVGKDAVYFDNPDLPQTRSEMALPLKVGEQVIGVLDVQSVEPAAFDEEDAAVLQTMADQIALALENARLLEESRRALRELGAMHAERVRKAWETTRVPPVLLYDGIEVTPTEPRPDPLVEKALQVGKAIGEIDPESRRSALVAPLRLHNQVIGALALEETDAVRPWTEDEIELVNAVSEQVALALESAHLFEETHIRAEELAVLNELGLALTARLTRDAVLEEAYRGAARLLDTTNFYIALYDPIKDEVTFALDVTEGQFSKPYTIRHAGHGLTEYVIHNRQPVLIQENLPERLAEMGIEPIGREALSWLGVPLLIGDQVLGVMAVQSYTRPRAYDEHDRDLLTAIASQVTIALQNAQLFEQTQEALAETEALYQANAALNAAQSYQDVLEVLCSRTILSKADCNVTIDVFDRPWTAAEKPEEIQILARRRSFPGELVSSRYALEDFPSASLLTPDAPVAISDMETDPRVDENVRNLFRQVFQARSAIFVPLVVGNQWIGYINGIYTQPAEFPEDELRQLMTLAGQAALAIYYIRQAKETRRRTAQLAAAAEVARDATAILDVDQLLDEAVHLISDTFGFYHAGVFLVDEQGKYAVLHAASSEGGKRMLARGHKLEVGKVGLVGYVTGTGEPRIALDVGKDAVHFVNPDLPETRSEMTLPLRVRGQVIGALDVQSTEEAAFTDEDVATLQTMADQLATAIENARLFEQTQHSLVETRELFEASRTIGAATSPSEVGQALIDYAATLGLDAARLLRYEFADNRPVGMVLAEEWSVDGQTHFGVGDRLPMLDSVLARLWQPEEVVVIENVHTDDRLDDQTRSILETAGLRSIAFIPLVVASRQIGGLVIGRRVPSAYPERLIRNLWTICGQAAIALENLRLLEETRRRARQLEVINAIGRVVSTSLDPDQVMKTILEEISHAVGCEFAVISLVDEGTKTIEGKHVIWKGQLDIFPEWVERSQYPLDHPDIIADVYRTGHIEVLSGWDERFNREIWEKYGHDRYLRLFMPIKLRDKVVGVIEVSYDKAHKERITEDEIRLLSTLMDQTAVALENARLFAETQQRAAQWEALTGVGRAIGSTLDLDEVLQLILERLEQVVPYNTAGLWLREGEIMRARASVGFDPEVIASLRVPFQEDALFRELVHTRQPLIIADAQQDARFRGFAGTGWVRSWLGVPLLSKDEVIGVLTIDSSEPGLYTTEMAELALTFGQQAAAAIENARFFEEAQRRAVQLEAAAEVARDATAILDVDQLLDETVHLISDTFGFYHAGVFLLDERGEYAVLRAASSEGGKRMLARGHKLEVGKVGLVGYVTGTGEPRIALDVGKDAVHFVNPDLPETRSEMTLPLRVRGQVIGALDVQSTEEAAFTEEDVAVLQTMADQLANAIENARLFEEVQHTAEHLKEVDQLKSQFLANMSHELRTPLNSIIGFSRVILKGIDGPITKQQQQDLEAIYNSGQHLLGLINDILDISKIEAGKMELSFQPIDFGEIIRGVMSTAIALVKNKPIELQQSVPADLPAVIADERRIRQVLLNLVSNAAKFTDEGFIRVEATCDEEFITVSVADSGIGIPSDKLPHIFEAFTQVDTSPARKYGGTGLGLAISKSFIELHGGEIWVKSESGKGSTFTFRLPIQGPPSWREPELVEGEEALSLTTADEDGAREGTDKRKIVLCVDDDEGVITLFHRYLDKQGYRVVGLTDPMRVLEEVKRLQPYAITLDVMMPGKDGWQVIQELKADPQTRDIPVIMCTIVSEEGRGITLGAADYLVKPILEQDLVTALERLNREEGAHRVLIVDDQPKDRNLLRRIIESQGYEVSEAGSGQEAIMLVRQQRPSIIILDLLMPEVDGFAVLEAVKTDQVTRSIPIIVVTAKELTDEDRQLLNNRIEVLIQKGALQQEELLEDVAAALRKMARPIRSEQREVEAS